MRRLVIAVLAAAAITLTSMGTASAAPKPTDPTGNHPAFPMTCSGGQVSDGTPVFGWVVVPNGRSLVNGPEGRPVLPRGPFYPGGDASGPDLSVKPIVGTSMYRQVTELGTGIIDESGRGNLTLDQVLERWDVADCSTVPLPGEALLVAYPDGGYEPGKFYVFRNWVK